MRVTALFSCALWLAACSATPSQQQRTSEAPSGITVALDRSAYRVGEIAEITITNHADSVVLFAIMCDGSMEGRARDKWEAVYEPDCSNIRVRPTQLKRGESSVLQFRVQPSDSAALPRYDAFRINLRFQFADGGGYQTSHSQVFTIEAE